MLNVKERETWQKKFFLNSLLLLLLATMTYNQVQLFRINYLADQSFSHVNNIWVNSLKTYSYV